MNVVRRCQTDSLTHLLYQAMLCYNNGRYKRALTLVQQSKDKISEPSYIYFHNTTKKCRELGLCHLPIETLLRRHYVAPIEIHADKNFPDIYLETHDFHTHIKGRTVIPPLVYALFLHYLCQRKLGHLREADDTLYELSVLVQHDDGEHIARNLQAVSWQILGICQQRSGKDRAACRSFITAQQTLYKEWFKFATSVRIGIILVKYF